MVFRWRRQLDGIDCDSAVMNVLNNEIKFPEFFAYFVSGKYISMLFIHLPTYIV